MCRAQGSVLGDPGVYLDNVTRRLTFAPGEVAHVDIKAAVSIQGCAFGRRVWRSCAAALAGGCSHVCPALWAASAFKSGFVV